MTEQHDEYRLVVRIGRDVPNGLKAGEDFVPFSEPSLTAWRLYPSMQWWQSAGHEPRIEVRQVVTTYTEWRER